MIFNADKLTPVLIGKTWVQDPAWKDIFPVQADPGDPPEAEPAAVPAEGVEEAREG